MQSAADIDFLSSIPSEVLQSSGRYGRVYDLQLRRDRAENRLSHLRESLHQELAHQRNAAAARGGFGPLGSDLEIVENHPEVRQARTELGNLTTAVAEARTEVGGIVFLPARENLGEIEKRLETLNRKAGKLGTDPITLTVTDEQLVLSYKTNDEDTRAYDFTHVFAVLSGTTPAVPGFEFLATITPTEHGNIVKRIPPIAYGVRHNLEFGNDDREDTAAKRTLDAIDLTRFRSTGDICEHCHKDRRRSDLYVVYNEQTGEAIQVGRTCLRDFTGLNNPERVLKILEQVQEFFRSVRGSRGETPVLSTEDFMTHCAAVLRAEGKPYITGLGYEASRNYYAKLYETRNKRTGEKLWIEPSDQDRHEGAAILKWAREEWDEDNEFAHNVKLALASQAMDRKNLGLGGAAFAARPKWQERQVEKTVKVESQHIGTVGQREVFVLTVQDIKWIADRYAYGEDATKPLIIMTDPAGNEVKWFASNLPATAGYDGPLKGATFQVKATVKYHDDDERWGRSTVITRAKFEKTIQESDQENDE